MKGNAYRESLEEEDLRAFSEGLGERKERNEITELFFSLVLLFSGGKDHYY